MAYIWFNSVLEVIGKKINYESISNLYGNSFAKDAAKVIMKAHPLQKESKTGSAQTLLSMPSKLIVIEGSKDAQIAQAEKTMGDMSWIKEYL